MHSVSVLAHSRVCACHVAQVALRGAAWSRTVALMFTTEELADAHDALDPLTNDSTFVDFAETVRITCALEYQTRGGVADADYLAERAAHDCLYGTSLTPRLQGLVRRACVSQMRRLFAQEVAS